MVSGLRRLSRGMMGFSCPMLSMLYVPGTLDETRRPPPHTLRPLHHSDPPITWHTDSSDHTPFASIVV